MTLKWCLMFQSVNCYCWKQPH